MSAQMSSKLPVQFQNIPFELRAYNQWVVWKMVVKEGLATKEPYQPAQSRFLASVTNPQTWGTFDQAVTAYNNDAEVTGIGFVFSESDPFFGIDIDDTDKVKTDKGVTERAEIIDLLRGTNTYTERSPLGKGLHLIGFGKIGDDRKGMKFPHAQIEVYASARYFTVTGDVQPGYGNITPQQGLLDALVKRRSVPTVDRSLGKTTAFLRRLDMTDEEVINYLLVRQSDFGPRFYAQEGFVNDWSGTYRSLVGDLDSVSGDPEQILRILLSAPIVTQSGAKNGETRHAKALRLFEDNLAETRSNREEQHHRWFPHMVDHGRQIAERMEAAKKAREEALRKENEQYALTLEQREEALGGLSEDAASMMNAFPFLPAKYKVLCRPPGLIGEFVEANEKATYYPYTKYAIPVTFAALSGLLGRQYKVDGSGLATSFILAAPLSTGKTEHGEAWDRFMSSACAEILGSSKRIIVTEAASIQGIFDQFMQTRSAAWFSEEAYSMLASMTGGKSETGDKLRNGFNKLFDASKRHKVYTVPTSRASADKGAKPIPNLNISAFWTMTPAEFRQFSGSSQDGFISRLIIVQEQREYGLMADHREPMLPEHLHRRLVDFAGRAQNLDNEYSQIGEHHHHLITSLVDIDYSYCSILFASIRQIVDEIRRRTLAEGTENWTIVGRIVPNVLRIAGTMAVVENPNAPSITPDQMLWALGYVVQNMVAFLSDVDKGLIGDKQSDEAAAVMRGFDALIRKPENKQLGGVPISKLNRYCRERMPFKGRQGGAAAVTLTTRLLVDEGTLIEMNALASNNRNLRLIVKGD